MRYPNWRLNIFFLVFLLFQSFSYVKAEDVKVLLRIGSNAEARSSNVTFARELAALVYAEIMNGNVTLWDSREKGLQITPVTLQGIENTTNTQFADLDYVFSYELWSRNRKGLSAHIYGFSFSSKGEDGNDVAFGYVDFSDLKQSLITTRVPTNADGDFNTTFVTALYRKLFDYSLFQFGNQIVNSWIESERIVHLFKNGMEFHEHTGAYESTEKMINYIVDSQSQFDDEKSRNSKMLLVSIENFLNSNKEIFFNLGGEKITNHIETDKVSVSKVEINELWVRKNGYIIFKPKSMIVHIGDKSLNRIPLTDMRKLKLEIADTDLVTFLKTKNYNFVINKINAEEIEFQLAYVYYKALLNTEWTAIRKYVANY